MSSKSKDIPKVLASLDIFKLTPKTNCGDCGQPACLAFAAQVIAGLMELDACPHLDRRNLDSVRERLKKQQGAGIGIKREGFEKALEYLRGEIRKQDLVSLAPSLGAIAVEREGKPGIRFAYFGGEVVVDDEDIRQASGEDLNPWEKILLYNYVIGGAAELSGRWTGMESLPNSVSKVKSLRAHCEEVLARKLAGRMDSLPAAVAGLGAPLELSEERTDFAAEFLVLPRLPIRVLWWDEDPAEGFEARVKFLFDSRVLQTLDLESLLFTCEQLTDRLLAAADRKPSVPI